MLRHRLVIVHILLVGVEEHVHTVVQQHVVPVVAGRFLAQAVQVVERHLFGAVVHVDLTQVRLHYCEGFGEDHVEVYGCF